MDPVTILSVCAAAFQFVDFGAGLLSEAKQTYVSSEGWSSRISDLSQKSTRLSELCSGVQDEIRQSSPSSTDQPTEIFLRLCDKCQEVNNELQDVVATFRSQDGSALGRVVKSTAAAARGVYMSSKITKLEGNLSDIRSEMMTAVIFSIRAESRGAGTELAYLKSQLNEVIKRLDNPDIHSDEFYREVTTLIDHGCHYEGNTKADEWDGLHSRPALENSTPVPDASTISDTRRQELDDIVLKGLFFDAMQGREDTVAEAHTNTFCWIFEEPRTDEGTPLWSDFSSWLRSETKDIYWITGKPGAGKSTLIKYLHSSPSLNPLLAQWSGDLPLVVSCFYSWNAGMRLQKSCEGLLRTLLYQIFAIRPGLMADVCSRRWLSVPSGTKRCPPPQLRTWTRRELLSCFEDILLRCGQSFRLALFVDGLDEFNDDHGEIVGLIHHASQFDGVKVCTSSRPWNVFEDAYSRGPMLRLERLTRGDIDKFIGNNFSQNVAFSELKDAYPQDAERLLQGIADKAEGVFLWVSLVVRDLLESVNEGDSLSQLQATLDRLPPDLSNLFDNIWNRIDDSRRHETARYLELSRILCSKNPPLTDLLTLWLAGEDVPLDYQLSCDSPAALENKAKIAKRKVNSRTRGLIQIFEGNNTNRFDWLHRSATDWYGQNRRRILPWMGRDYDCNLAIAKALTAKVCNGILDPEFVLDGTGFLTEDMYLSLSSMLYFVRKTVKTQRPKGIHLMDRLYSAFGPDLITEFVNCIPRSNTESWMHGKHESRVHIGSVLALLPLPFGIRERLLFGGVDSWPALDPEAETVIATACFPHFFPPCFPDIRWLGSCASRFTFVTLVLESFTFTPDTLRPYMPQIKNYTIHKRDANNSKEIDRLLETLKMSIEERPSRLKGLKRRVKRREPGHSMEIPGHPEMLELGRRESTDPL